MNGSPRDCRFLHLSPPPPFPRNWHFESGRVCGLRKSTTVPQCWRTQTLSACGKDNISSSSSCSTNTTRNGFTMLELKHRSRSSSRPGPQRDYRTCGSQPYNRQQRRRSGSTVSQAMPARKVAVTAVAGAVMMLSFRADGFLVSPQQLLAPAVARTTTTTTTATEATIGQRGLSLTRASPRVVVGMVSAAGVASASSATTGEESKEERSLGERVRADFPILDQVCA